MATTAIPTPAAPASGGDFNSSLDSMFAKAETAVESADAADAGETSDATEEATEQVEAPAEEPVAEPEVEAAAEPEPEPVAETPEQEEIDPADEIKPDRVSPDGKTLHFSKAKAARLLAARDFQSKVSEIIPQASVEEIGRHYNRSVMVEQMVNDFDSASPEAVQRWGSFWFGKNSDPQAVAATVQALPDLLASHPQAQQHLERTYTERIIESLYQEAHTRGNDDLLALAQNLDYVKTGNYRQKEQLQAAHDPRVREQEEFRREKAEFEQRRKTEQEARVASWLEAAEQNATASIDEEIDKALAPVKEKFEKTPQWKHMRRDLRDAVDAAIKANPTWRRDYENKRHQARSRPSDESRQALTAMKRQFAAAVIGKHRKGVIDAATGAVLSTAATAHSQKAAIAAKREPTASGSPIQRANRSEKVKAAQGYESKFEAMFEGIA